MMLQQRDSVSGVSIEEEMSNLITYQYAYQASSKIITTADQMLQTVVNLKST
jgi:flagellar hook-associated protein 1 FlgK